MDRQDIVLAGLATALGASFSPVQVQKFFFLIDRTLANAVGGPFFEFKPYDYGPFDKTVYDVLKELSLEGNVDIIPERTWRSYKLTAIGQQRGEAILNSLPEPVQTYLKTLSDFVRSLSFTQLVSAIYKAYPEMRENSVFQE